MNTEIRRRMQGFDLFSTLTDAECASVATVLSEVRVKKGDVLFKEGDRGDSAYVIISGKIAIGVASREISVLEKGSIFGEASLVSELTRSATATATADAALWKISRKEFLRLMGEGNLGTYKICARIAGALAGRLLIMNKKLQEAFAANTPGREMDRIKNALLKDWSF
jgi:CRP-like cAMP-binding protein